MIFLRLLKNSLDTSVFSTLAIVLWQGSAPAGLHSNMAGSTQCTLLVLIDFCAENVRLRQ